MGLTRSQMVQAALDMGAGEVIEVECEYCDVTAPLSTMRPCPGAPGFVCADTAACDARGAVRDADEDDD